MFSMLCTSAAELSEEPGIGDEGVRGGKWGVYIAHTFANVDGGVRWWFLHVNIRHVLR